jgi:uncharacterized protein YndB with AHSA1/START domain
MSTIAADNAVEIETGIDAVFAFFADGTNNPRWRTDVIEIHRDGDTAGLGAVFRQTMSGPGGRNVAGDYRITEFEEPTRIAFEVITGPARPRGTFELTAIDPQHTRVRFRLELEPHGAARLMAPMIRSQMTKEVAALDNVGKALSQP